jgi:GT2 family glycosyltransferase/glycosyltransferase involved in cell wall biosynthesis
MVKSRSNELQQKVVEGEEQARLLQNQISQKDQELARLQAELVLVQGELHRIQTTTLYRSIRTGVKNVLRKILPAWLKEFLKKITGRALPVEPVQLPMLPPASAGVLIDKAGWGDFFESITLLPSLTRKDQRAILAHPPLDILLRRPDIICFSIIDWDFRYQRPQQIMSQFAAQGYRVFYISPVYFRTSDSTPKVQVQKIKENIYEVKLAVQRIPDMFGEVIEGVNSQVILASLDELRLVYKVEEAISYVMIASWEIVALETKKKWAWRVVYDCMDEWNNFPLIKPAIITGEQHLVENCDLLVVTSQRLYDNWRDRCRLMVLARNATDYQFYAQRLRPNELLTGRQHPIIGYYGAIADWFDLELMTYVAEQRPGYTFVLLGGIFDMDVSHLQALSNVNLLGQQPYETMPQYLYHFDVCLIPFKINTITEATDPVKVYEYLCGGKPVVSVALPELNSFRDLLYIAQDKDEFLVKLDQAVAEHNPQLVAQRKEFAQKNTWEKRYEVIAGGITSYTPRASIIVVTHNNLVLTRLCIESIFRNTDYPDFEVIVVDNNSTDGTRAYLGLLANQRENFKVILNPTNIGLAKANNQGLVSATGDYLILLENHVIVSPGWLSRMTLYLSDAKVGMVGPLTNFAGNEARLNLAYSTLGEMQTFAGKSTRQNEKTAVEITRLGMFCVAFRRDVFQIAGPLDERNKIGKLEEDDFAKRLRQSGYKIICAQDVFVHRFDRAAFAKWPLQPLFEKIQLWVENKRTVM